MVHHLSARDARRIAVRAQLLDLPRPGGLLETIRGLGVVQVDLTAAVAPSVDLVCWSRLGAAYDPQELDRLLDERTVVEYRGVIRPSEDIALLRADMETWPGRGPLRGWQRDNRDWVRANDFCRREILHRLRTEGPLAARQLPDTCAVPWRSSGWSNERNVTRLLDFMEARGEVAVSGRRGRERLWDLADRVYPETGTVPPDDARILRDRLRLKALGIARATGPEAGAEPIDVGRAGEPAVVDGVRGTWRVDPEQLDRLGRPFRGRAAILSPLDRLVGERRRLTELFGFDYHLERYQPAARRRWGYYALPVLQGDRFVGKLDASAEPTEGVLRVNALHEDVVLTLAGRSAIIREVRGLASWLGLEPLGVALVGDQGTENSRDPS